MKNKTKTTTLIFLPRFVLLLFFFLCTFISYAKSPVDSLLVELDRTIGNGQIYTGQKMNYIHNLRLKFSATGLNNEDQYLLYQQLAKEYESFRCDTAILYSTERLRLAEELGNTQWINESKFQLASVLSKACMFDRAIKLLNSIDKNNLSHQQLVHYYKAYLDNYIYQTEFYQYGYQIEGLSNNRKVYRDSLLMVLNPNTLDYVVNYGTKYIESGETEKAEELLFSYYHRLVPDTKDYALYASILAYFYESIKDREKRKEFLARSAIADLKVSNKENISLRFLASMLLTDKDVKRANLYIKQSMDDANFYNGRLRNLQTSTVLPIINEAYQAERTQQQRKLVILLMLVSFLVFILLLTLYFIKRQMNKLSRAKDEIVRINQRLNELNADLQQANYAQKEMNQSLQEANYIKEQLIGSFLEICTEYIDKFQKFKIFVNRKIKVGQFNDILKITAKTEISSQELKDLYANFDRAFLAIYPDFIEQFNNLLREEERYKIKDNQTLNQELRIFALVRLGITDSNKIATFLHYTLRTIYNYRHKVKSKAINPHEDFEERIRRICIPDLGE